MKFLVSALAISWATTSLAGNSFRAVQSLDEIPSGLIYNTEQPPAGDPQLLQGKRIAILASHGVQESELKFPYEFLKSRGAEVEILAPSWIEDRVLLVQFLKPSLWVDVDATFSAAASSQYDMIVLTGGAWNSTVVRGDQDALKLLRDHYSHGGWVASICSAGQVLIDAGLATARRLTATKSIKVDLENAGAEYIDEAVVIDDRLITSRNPEDLIPFVEAIAKALLE